MLTMIGSIILGMECQQRPIYHTSHWQPGSLSDGSSNVLNTFSVSTGVLADVTPPVALATYASAGIAKSEPLKTGFTALRQPAGFIVPTCSPYNPGLLLQERI